MLEWQLGIRGVTDAHDTLGDMISARGALIESTQGDALLVASFTDPPDLIIIDAVGAWLSNLRLADAEVLTRLADDAPWQQGWRAIFLPFAVSQRLHVVPVWEEAPPDTDDAVHLIIDPSNAFGAGAHPTTATVLDMLDRCMAALTAEEPSVLDVGSGTGILAIAAAKFGGRTVGVEIDAQACDDSVVNARINGVADRYEVRCGSIETVSDRYDIVVANIYRSLLVRLAPPIMAAATGELILSGTQTKFAEEVLAAYPDFSLVERRDDRDWTTLWLRRDAAPSTGGAP